MDYRRELNSLNILMKTAIKLDNKLYKLVIEMHHNNINSKI